MGDRSGIEWTDASWNPVTGCDRVSPGCANCYALTWAARMRAMGQPGYQRDGDPRTSGPGFGLTLHPDRLDQPLRWTRPRRIFVNSMSDLFHPEVPDEFIAQVFAVMDLADQHTFQVLTKRPQRMCSLLASTSFRNAVADNVGSLFYAWPLPNVWLGVSIETRQFVHRADVLRETPAAVRFVSAEPLLGPLVTYRNGCPEPVWDGPYKMRCSLGWRGTVCARHGEFTKEVDAERSLDLTDIDWLIVGGESGGRLGRRLVDEQGQPTPERVQWVRDLRDACLGSPTAFFFKQWGGPKPGSGGRELDGRTWDEFPAPATDSTNERKESHV